MPKNRQYYRKTKYPDKVTKPKRLVFVRIFLFCSARSKITYFPTVPFCIKKAAALINAAAYIIILLQMQYSVRYLLCPSLVPELCSYISAGSSCHIELTLICVSAFRTFP